MFRRNLVSVWVGIILLSGMFLMGCDDDPMVTIPEGCFEMGDTFSLAEADALPVHRVCLSPFEMDVHEVTNAQYAECVAGGGCSLPLFLGSDSRATYYGDPTYADFPVIWVNWYQATEYCTWAGKRLPTEAEWEYAARGGLVGKLYPWGDAISGADANYWDSGDPWDNDTSQVMHYAPNGYGLYDMAGNVQEWVNDWYDEDYYQYCIDHRIVSDPVGPPDGMYRVMRGDSWFGTMYSVRVALRAYVDPDQEFYGIGFRCAR